MREVHLTNHASRILYQAMTLLYLIRHGRSTWNAEGRVQGQADAPLDDEGREQARKLARKLQDIDFDAFYSSPLSRARETAKIVAEPHDLPITFDERLMERSFGSWTGKLGAEVDEEIKNQPHINWRLDGAPGGESRIQVSNRAAGVFNEIINRHHEQTIAIVSHGGLLGIYLERLLGLPIDTPVWIHFGNTAVARIRFQNGQIHIISLNDDSHLDMNNQ